MKVLWRSLVNAVLCHVSDTEALSQLQTETENKVAQQYHNHSADCKLKPELNRKLCAEH